MKINGEAKTMAIKKKMSMLIAQFAETVKKESISGLQKAI